MPFLSNSVYQVTLPAMDPGDFEYYYRTDFTGYAYNGPLYPTVNTVVDNASDFSQWLKNGTINEMKSPTYYAYYGDFSNSQLYNVSVKPPVCVNDSSVLTDDFDYLSFNIRRFRSKHDTVSLQIIDYSTNGVFGVEPQYNMEQVGDYVWQAVMRITNAIDIGVAVVGSNRYTSGAVDFETLPHTWLEENQADTAQNPPMAGTTVDNSGGERIKINIDYNGFLMFRFCTTNGTYEVRRAAWQDFNDWHAPEEEYTRSFGLEKTTEFESTLDEFSPTHMDGSGILPFETGTSVSSSMLSSYYLNGLKVDKAWVIEEYSRAVITNKSLSDPLNRAVRLSATTNMLGSIQTTSITASDGRDTLRLRVRASVNDDNFSVYRSGYSFENYLVTAKATVASMSDDDPSVSVIGYYTDADNYLEGRVTQRSALVANSTTNSFSFLLEVRQRKNGVESILTSTTSALAPANKLTSGNWYLGLQIVSSNATSGSVQMILKDNSQVLVKATSAVSFSIDSSTIIGGTIGANAREANATLALSMLTSAGGHTTSFDAVETSVAGSWYLGGKMEATSSFRWNFTQGVSGTSTSAVTRVIPNVKYRVSVYRDGLNNNPVAPVPTSTADWDYAWDLLGDADNERSMTNLTWQTVSVPMHLWDNVFIQVRPVGTDGALVVDDMSVDAWRGKTIYDPALAVNDPNEELVWKSTYAVASKQSDGEMVYEINRSRANPTAEQKLVSPLLVEGIGDVLFNYLVTTGNVAFSVQSIKSNGEVFQTLLTTNVYASSMNNVFGRMYVPCLTNMTGRLRIIVDNQLSSTNGVLLIDNLKATDYPAVGDTSWEAYNVLISTFTFAPDIKFDGAANTEYRSSSINDSFTNNTPLNVEYNADQPYIQSPKIETGIGEVSFWYRVYPNATRPGKLYLKAAKTVSAPEAEWITLATSDLNPAATTYQQQKADLEGLTNIVNQTWVYASVEFYKADYKILRLYGDTEDGARVMLDNVIVTEPVRTSIDIGSVELNPAIPLYTDQVGVSVRLINPRMNPHDISVKLYYTTGTNTWGYNNWMGSASMVQLNPDPSDKYHFSVSNAIPKLPIDTVVQYSVKVDYQGTFPSPVYSGDTFVNPAWYDPIDLNASYATNGASRTSYYYVFSVGTNCVFINEFLPWALSGGVYYGLAEQYVEMIGPDNGNIANWSLEHINVTASASKDVAQWTNIISSTGRFSSRFVSGSTEPTNKFWGFYTLGGEAVSVTNASFTNPTVVDQVLFPASLYLPDYSFFADQDKAIGMGVPGGLCLKRSMGAYVHRLAWGATATIAPLVSRGYTPLVARGTTPTNRRKAYIWKENGSQDYPALAWMIDTGYTPGYYNAGQAVLIWAIDPAATDEAPSTPPAVVTSIASIALGDTAATILFDVSSTNSIALTAEDGFTWYVETSPDMMFTNSTPYKITSPITAPASGTNSTYSVDVNFEIPPAETLFYRVKAVPGI